ncbi:hypothetical protein T310_8673, partial [Rasamsonia emersonii CBS 393.64]
GVRLLLFPFLETMIYIQWEPGKCPLCLARHNCIHPHSFIPCVVFLILCTVSFYVSLFYDSRLLTGAEFCLIRTMTARLLCCKVSNESCSASWGADSVTPVAV